MLLQGRRGVLVKYGPVGLLLTQPGSYQALQPKPQLIFQQLQFTINRAFQSRCSQLETHA